MNTILRRNKVTIASRIMLPTYVIVFCVLGYNYLWTDLERLAHSPTLNYADGIISLRVWGGLFLVAGLLMITSLIIGNRILKCYILVFCAVCMYIWMVIFAAAGLNSEASPSAWVWPFLAGQACYASFRSLSKREV